jgi:lysozyme
MSLNDKALKTLKIDEGIRYSPYKDSLGYWTIGVGHLIGKELHELKLSDKVVTALLYEDLDQATKDTCELFGEQFHSFSEARKCALIGLTFNLGLSKFSKFKNTIKAIKENAWQEAADHLRQSLWAKQVDPKNRLNSGRDDRIIHAIKTGCFHEEYNIE